MKSESALDTMVSRNMIRQNRVLYTVCVICIRYLILTVCVLSLFYRSRLPILYTLIIERIIRLFIEVFFMLHRV